jgi:hypothetical protein
VEETDASAPTLVPPRAGAPAGWLYYHRTLAGQQYAIHCRRPAPAGVSDPRDLPDELRRPVDPHDPPADEVVLLDENVEAAEHDYFRLGGYAVSPDGRLAAEPSTRPATRCSASACATCDGRLLADEIPRAGYGLAWYEDARTLLYTVPDDAWRPHQVWRHRVGTSHDADELIVQEDDERFWLGVGRTRSRAFLAIQAGSKITSEWHLLDAHDPPPRPAWWPRARRASSTTSTTAATGSTSSPTRTVRRTSSCAPRPWRPRGASTGSTSSPTGPGSGSRPPTPSPTSSCSPNAPRRAPSCGSAIPRPGPARSCRWTRRSTPPGSARTRPSRPARCGSSTPR